MSIKSIQLPAFCKSQSSFNEAINPNGFSTGIFRIDNRGFKLLTNFDKSEEALYKAAVEEAKKLNLPYADKLEVSETTYSGKGQLLKNHSALKLYNPNNEFFDLNDFWRLFEKMSKDGNHV